MFTGTTSEIIKAVIKTDSTLVTALKIFEKMKLKIQQKAEATNEVIKILNGL